MGSVRATWSTAVAAALLLDCAPDNVGAGRGGESETGHPDTDPIDPIDGEGAVPPGNPSLDDQWITPSSLGNGLVHDTRAGLDPTVHVAEFSEVELAAGVAWSSFVDSNTAMATRGFRPAQVDATVELTDELGILDETLYISDDDANYRTEVFTHVFGTLAAERAFADWAPVGLGARPTSIHTFAANGRVGYSVAWVYDSATADPAMAWVMKVGQTEAELAALLADADLRPISLASRRRAGANEYAVILVASESPENWSASVDQQSSSLAGEIATRWEDGFYPFRITSKEGDSTRVNVLWAKRPPGISVQTRVNLTSSTFEEEDAWWRSHGYHLETVETYVEGGEQRQAAVWVRYQPYLRWIGTQFVPADMTYTAKYKMFHDQVLRIIGNFSDVDCSGGQPCPAGTGCWSCPAGYPCFQEDVCVEADFGQFTRPSATLHIFERDELVLNRAYTYAPAVYPDTPLNASMKTGSTAKSITAAAVVREVDIQGQSLNWSFAGAIGITPIYFLEYPGDLYTWTVRVRDVLDNQGGFPGAGDTPASYFDHADIVAAGATVPVDGQELFEYVFAPPPDGRVNLGDMDDDTYWQPEWFIMDRQSGMMRYSNTGYSLVGELVRVQSGLPYEEYVANELLAPLGLQDRIYPDPGNRVRSRGPTNPT